MPGPTQRHALAQRLAGWLRATVEPLVEHGDQLLVEPSWAGEATLLLRVKTASRADVGRLVGRGGVTGVALRRLVSVTGARLGVSIALEIALAGQPPERDRDGAG